MSYRYYYLFYTQMEPKLCYKTDIHAIPESLN